MLKLREWTRVDATTVTEAGRRLNSLAGLVRVALWAGVLAGALQVVGLAIRKWGLGEFLFAGPDVWWTTPVTTMVVFILIAIAMSMLGRWSHRAVWSPLMGTFVFLATLSFLGLFPQVHRLASVVLAMGIGFQGFRMIERRPLAFERMVRRTTPSLVLLVMLATATIRGTLWTQERLGLAALGSAPTGVPNILLIVLDTVRAFNLSLLGYHRPTSPTLEHIAREGANFTHAFTTSPWTLPSHASMFTGRYVHEFSADWLVPLDDEWATLAEVLASVGYLTVGISGNTDYASREVGLGRGFAHFEDYPLSLSHILRSTPLTRMVVRNKTLRKALGLHDALGRRHAPVISDRLLRWLDARDQRPYFAFVNYYDAHRPYWPPEAYRHRFIPDGEGYDSRPSRRAEPGDDTLSAKTDWAINAYDGALAYLDDQIGQLLHRMEQEGLLDNTLLIITSDHGEEFGEHGMFDHGNSLYRQAVEVPLLLRFPGRLPAGIEVTLPVSLAALPATIMDLIGVETHPFPGYSLKPLLEGEDGPTSPVLSEVRKVIRQPEWYPASQGDLAAIISGDWRYIRNLQTGEEELYDYRLDVVEASDLARDTAAAAAVVALRATLTDARDPRRPGTTQDDE